MNKDEINLAVLAVRDNSANCRLAVPLETWTL